MTEHTKLPWRNQCFQILGADNSRIAHTGMGNLPPSRSSESEANAAFIVKAVNNHMDLLRALTEMVQAFDPFTSKPMGAPGSDARNQQQLQIAAHRNAREVLARLNDPVGGSR